MLTCREAKGENEMNKEYYNDVEQKLKQQTVSGQIEHVVSVPVEVLDLLRFMCATWTDVDKWAHKNMTVGAFGNYPQIQGASNQINLQRIGEQEHSTNDLHKAVEWMKAH